jgi:transcriptional regulator with XRE-family HTH domain
MKTLADRIKFRMDAIGWIQDDLAKLVGVSQTAIFKVMAGQTAKPRNILEIAKALGVNAEWLSTGNGEMTGKSEHQVFELTARQQQVIAFFDQLPESEQDKLLNELKEKSLYFNKIFEEMISRA